jgi:hypothetical protein
MYVHGRLERFLKYKTFFVFKMHYATGSVVNFYNAVVVTQDRRSGTCSQSYDRELQRQSCKYLQRHE